MIDWNRVNELRDEVGIEDFGEVVEIFLEEVDEVIARLRSNELASSLEEELHFLKGCCLNLGFAKFSSLCSDGEKAASSGHAETVNVFEIVTAYDLSRTNFVDQLAQ